MAHTCPVCGNHCHCGGDIDDLIFNDTAEQDCCICCEYEDSDGSDFDDDKNDDHDSPARSRDWYGL